MGEQKEKEVNTLQENMHTVTYFVKTFLKWLVLGSIMGAICGIVGVTFHSLTGMANDFRAEHPEIIYALPIAGLFIVFLYQISGVKEDKGTNMVIASIRFQDELPLRMTPLIYIGTVLTHLFGGSSGREGAALQIGGSLGATLGKWLNLDERDVHMMTMCGMSAVFTALFGTPITATIFSIEVVSIGILHYSAIVPCVLSSTVAYAFARRYGVEAITFSVNKIPYLNPMVLGKVIALSALCALVSILFCFSMHATGKYLKKWIKNPYLRVVAGSVFIILVTLLVGSQRYNGVGMNVIEDVLHYGQIHPWDFAVKIALTAVTLGCGFKGGEIVPSFFVGATFGGYVGSLMGLDPSFGAAIGMICLFCGAVNCPIASLFLSVELFGAKGILLMAVACAVSYMLSGYFGLYSSQMIVYSKVHQEYINRYTK